MVSDTRKNYLHISYRYPEKSYCNINFESWRVGVIIRQEVIV